jgi:hypothetical protein
VGDLSKVSTTSFSKVLRAWAFGTTVIEPGKVLVVSRGIGMERMGVPQIRFFVVLS